MTYSPGKKDCTSNDGQHDFAEAIIGREDADGVLKDGMKVMLPCKFCHMGALEQLNEMGYYLEETQRAFTRLFAHRSVALYHWAPSARRKQINRYGLRPGQRPTTHAGTNWRATWVCFADTPSWAWALSGGQESAPAGEWDLWQTYTDRLTDALILPSIEGNGVHEVRTEHRVYKRDLWLAAGRVKP
ncbi:MAG TPA: hypothetical protein VF642_12345 [Propionibacteriaceae bacterium]